MRCKEGFIKAANQFVLWVEYPVTEYAERFFFQLVFADSVVMVEGGLRSPADMECAVNVGMCSSP